MLSVKEQVSCRVILILSLCSEQIIRTYSQEYILSQCLRTGSQYRQLTDC
jgi:hypothetical protein